MSNPQGKTWLSSLNIGLDDFAASVPAHKNMASVYVGSMQVDVGNVIFGWFARAT
jgi:hypothetical protein